MALLQGYLLGLGFVIFLGPVFFYLLKCTLDSGFSSGLSVALGIVFADFLCISICSLGAIAFFENKEIQLWLGLLGSIILFFLGLKFILKPSVFSQSNEPVKLSKSNYVSFFTQGFLINFVNPFVFVIWIVITSNAKAEYGNSNDFYLFLAAALAGIFTTDFLKVLTAHRIKQFLRPEYLSKTYKIFGIILIIFGVWVLYHILNKYF
ncbi:MAG: LysE family transporter [Flavobacteriales bacterium]|nr:LysE family transporter [Flavobacteriales bacterium]